ncbi:MAG: hypoxanthine phosphoribosyltransferase [Lachnospiraceae bacterium]|nr:hypoxanthine phosphoribosyltransferase [Lachnospiraceae bacterium]MDY5741675.1 hypoxanthine phosphoribosyltransferase [Lachnospiraceae bacterium]
MGVKIHELYSEETVNKRVEELGAQISRDYAGKQLHLISVLKGGVFFACELAKRLTIPVTIDFMCISSYGSAMESSGIVKILKDLDEPLAGRDVLIVEDIIDSGNTLAHLKGLLSQREPASLKICTLLDKPERRDPAITLKVDYVGFEIPDHFVVGYGLDYAQNYRNLPYIGIVELTEE